MTKFFISFTYILALFLGSTLSDAYAMILPYSSKAAITNAQTKIPSFKMNYLGMVIKYEANKGALVKIVKVNPDPQKQGIAAFLNVIVYLPDLFISQMIEKDIKIGDYIEFQTVTSQVIHNPYAPFIGNQSNSQGYQTTRKPTTQESAQSTSQPDPKWGNQMITSVPKIIVNGRMLHQAKR